MSTTNRTRFDDLASEWDSNPTRVELAAAVSDAIAAAVPLSPTMRVMDFGAGTGLVTLRLAPRVREVVAADVSPGMLGALGEKVARAGIANVRTLVWDAEAGDCPEGGFDAVVSSMAMHHVRDTDRLFRTLAKALAPGGWVALADLETEDGTFHADPTGVHHKGFDREEMRNRLEAAGFDDVVTRDAHVVRRVGPQGERRYPVFLIAGRVAGQ